MPQPKPDPTTAKIAELSQEAKSHRLKAGRYKKELEAKLHELETLQKEKEQLLKEKQELESYREKWTEIEMQQEIKRRELAEKLPAHLREKFRSATVEQLEALLDIKPQNSPAALHKSPQFSQGARNLKDVLRNIASK